MAPLIQCCDDETDEGERCKMPVQNAIVMLLVLGSSGSFLWAGNESLHNRAANCESQANQEDTRRLAQKAFADGKQFAAEGTADSLRKALGSYEKALGFFRTLGDHRAEAGTLGPIGEVYYFLDEQQKAL